MWCPVSSYKHPFRAGNLTWTSVPAHDATYGPCMSVAGPDSSGVKGIQRMHSRLQVLQTEMLLLSGNKNSRNEQDVYSNMFK